MFEPSISPKQFLRALEKLDHATAKAKPAALNSGIKRILARAEGFDGTKFDDLASFIAAAPKRTAAKKRTSSSKLKPYSASLVREIVAALDEVVSSQQEFELRVHGFAKSCNAKAIKEAAAEYAASAVPATKSAAIGLLKSERANRIRTQKKMAESARAAPW